MAATFWSRVLHTVTRRHWVDRREGIHGRIGVQHRPIQLHPHGKLCFEPEVGIVHLGDDRRHDIEGAVRADHGLVILARGGRRHPEDAQRASPLCSAWMRERSAAAAGQRDPCHSWSDSPRQRRHCRNGGHWGIVMVRIPRVIVVEAEVVGAIGSVPVEEAQMEWPADVVSGEIRAKSSGGRRIA